MLSLLLLPNIYIPSLLFLCNTSNIALSKKNKNKGCVLSRTVSITVLLISLLGTQSHSIIRFPYCVIYHNEMLHFISKFTLYYSAFCDFSACHKLKWLIANNFEQGYYGKLK